MSRALGPHSHRAKAGTEKWLLCLAEYPLRGPRALDLIDSLYDLPPIRVCYLCSAQTLFQDFLINFRELSHKCNFPMRQNDRCFPLRGPSQCQNGVSVASFIFMQNFAGLLFIILQESSFCCSQPGNMMRSIV